MSATGLRRLRALLSSRRVTVSLSGPELERLRRFTDRLNATLTADGASPEDLIDLSSERGMAEAALAALERGLEADESDHGLVACVITGDLQPDPGARAGRRSPT